MTANLIGQQIEHYRIEAIVGEGGMGTVYRATDVNLARPVAMKVMHPNFAAQPQFQQRFQQEAQAAARLDHPSIVGVYHFGRQHGLIYMVMELVPGLSLGAYLKQLAQRNQIVRLDETTLLMAQVAEALGYAHRKGVVHRDIKPDNIIVKRLDYPGRLGDPPLRAVVTDFGLAKLLEGGVQTHSGEFMGTLAYVSPEQVMDRPLDGRSDIYSLGVVLFQLATGQLPFEVRTPSDAVMKHLNQPPPRPRDVQPGVPAALSDVILTALAKQPEHRFQTGEEMASALRAAAAQLDDQSVQAAVAGTGSVVVSMVMHINGEDEPSEAEPAQPDAEHNTAVRARDQLILSQPGQTSEAVVLAKPIVTIGRSDDNDVVLTGSNVSRHHVRLERRSGTWTITDLGSTNGTFLAGRRLPPDRPKTWHSGDRVRIGKVELVLKEARKADAPAQDEADTPPRPAPPLPPPPRFTSAPVEQIEADMRPALLTDGGICRVLVLNKGEARTNVSVSAGDPQGQVRFDMPSKQVSIGPGQKGVVDFYVEPQKRPFIGRSRTTPYAIRVSTASREWAALTGQLKARPVVSGWLWMLVLLLLPVFILLLLFASGMLA